MEIKIIEETKSKVSFKLVGESHTLCNALKEELRSDNKVNIASYYVSHPDIDEPTFTVEGTSPKKSILAAINNIKKHNEKFLKSFNKEVK